MNYASDWPRIPPNTLGEQAYRAIRARIVEGLIAPGEFVREKDVNEAMGISRTPVREALYRLATEGFLERIPHRGFRVPEEPLKNLLELYPIVASLDLLAGRLAIPRLRPDDLARLSQINSRLRRARDAGDATAASEHNGQFHDLFAERSANSRLAELLRDLRSQLTRLELWYYSDRELTQRSISEHDDIIQALVAGDHERALTLLEHNMSLTYTQLLEGSASGA